MSERGLSKRCQVRPSRRPSTTVAPSAQPPVTRTAEGPSAWIRRAATFASASLRIANPARAEASRRFRVTRTAEGRRSRTRASTTVERRRRTPDRGSEAGVDDERGGDRGEGPCDGPHCGDSRQDADLHGGGGAGRERAFEGGTQDAHRGVVRRAGLPDAAGGQRRDDPRSEDPEGFEGEEVRREKASARVGGRDRESGRNCHPREFRRPSCYSRRPGGC